MSHADACACPKCRARRGEHAYDPPSKAPADLAGQAERRLVGITDPLELAVLCAVMLPGGKPCTREKVREDVGKLEPTRGATPPAAPETVEVALDRLIAAGLIADEGGELRLTDVAEDVARAERNGT